MSKKFMLKSILFYTLSAICALTITGVTNIVIYWFFSVAGLSDFGSMLLFRAGLAISETAIAVYCVSQISEDVLYGNGEYDKVFVETTDEKAT